MNRGARTTLLLAFAVLGLLATALPAAAVLVLQRPDWVTLSDGQTVQFHLRFENTGPGTSGPVSGDIHSQYYGAFLPDYGTIGTFDVPPLQPSSFFDVFVEVPLSSLPKTTETFGHSPGTGPGTGFRPAVDCAPGDHWDGNVDINWAGPGGAGHANYHIGDIKACPGGGNSYIHVLTFCPSGIAPWSITGGCPGWSAALVNEDLTPAPPVLPPGWTGFISIHADASVPDGTVCCFHVNMVCGDAAGVIDLCATACNCVTPVAPSSWGRIKSLYR